LSVTAGLVVCGAVTVVLDQPCRELGRPVPAKPSQSLETTPCSQEYLAVRNWILEHRPEAGTLEFLAWSAPKQVADNPFRWGPATLVTVIVKNKDAAPYSLEQLSFYLCNLEVLGSLSEPYDGVMAAVFV
jgi:hypothetical protein